MLKLNKKLLLEVMQQAMEKDRRAKASVKEIKSFEEVRAGDVEVLKKKMAQTPEKGVLRYAKVLSRMQKSKNGYDPKEYAVMEGKLKEAIAAVSQDEELKKGIVEYLKQPTSQSVLHHLTEDIRGQLIASMKDVGVLIAPKGENTKGFEINRDTLSEGLMKDFVESEKLGKILTNKLGYKSADFVKEGADAKSKDKDSKLVIKSKGDRASMT